MGNDISIKLKAVVGDFKRDMDNAFGGMERTASLSFAKIAAGAAAAVVSMRTLQAAAGFVREAIKAASDLQETTGKFDVVFRGAGESAHAMADEIGESFAMSDNEAMSFMSTMGDMLKPMGMNVKEAAKMSAEIVKLSADLGSFNNLPTADVMRDIQSAMVGNYETVRKYGTMISAASIEQGIMNKGLARTKEEITPLLRMQEVYAQIVQNNADAIGDMARTQDDLANRSKRLAADIENLKAKFGAAVIESGALDRVLDELNPAMDELTTYISDHKDEIGQMAVGMADFAVNAGRAAIQIAKLLAPLGELSNWAAANPGWTGLIAGGAVGGRVGGAPGAIIGGMIGSGAGAWKAFADYYSPAPAKKGMTAQEAAALSLKTILDAQAGRETQSPTLVAAPKTGQSRTSGSSAKQEAAELERALEKIRQTMAALDAEAIDEAERAANYEVAIREEAEQAKLDAGETTFEQYLAAQIGFENDLYTIEKAAQEKRIALAEQDPNNPVNVQRERNKLLQIERKHLLERAKLENQFIKESKKQWNDLNRAIGDGIGNAFGDWMVGLTGTMDMFSAMLRSVQQAFSQVISNIVSEWIQGQLRMLIFGRAADAEKVASAATTSTAITAAKTAEATGVVTANAAEAASGAAASQAAIPIAGPALAAAAFAGTMALVLGAMKLFSASGGFDVPAGTNPMTQLHAREMVLPAHLADKVRNATSGGSGGGPTVHLNISALDGKSVHKMIVENKRAVAKALKDVLRSGGTGQLGVSLV